MTDYINWPITPYNVYAVHWELFSALEGYNSALGGGGGVQCIGGTSSVHSWTSVIM